MSQVLRRQVNFLTIFSIVSLCHVSLSHGGDYFLPVDTATAGSFLGAGLLPTGAINGVGMDDGNAGLKTALSDAQATGFGMWLTDFFADANGASDPFSTAWIAFDFGEVISGIDQMLVWNYNQATATNRGMRNVDITYSTTDGTGLGNTLATDYLLTEGTGVDGMPFTDDVGLSTPEVGISARSIRITASNDPNGNGGNFGAANGLYGLSEVRFYTVNPSISPGLRVWDGGSGSWTFNGNWDVPDAPVTNEYSALFGNASTGPATVYTNTAVAVSSIEINNANTHVFAGAGAVTLDATSGNASIDVLGTGDPNGAAGDHSFQLPVALADNTDVTVGTDSSLAFDNQVDLMGNILSLSGAVSLNHSVVDTVGGGSVSTFAAVLGTEGNTSISGDLTLDGGTLDIDVRDSSMGVTSDQIDVLGSATLEGNLTVNVDVLGGFSPTSSVPILTTTGGITDNSLSISLTGPGAGSFTGVGVVGDSLMLLAGLPGDFDFDGDVDGFDFLKWQRGESPDPLSQSDLTSWETNYGAETLQAVTTTVPEPSTSMLLTVLASALWSLRLRQVR